MEKDEKYFLKKQECIQLAIDKVKSKLAFFKKRSEKMFSNFEFLSEEQKEKAREINNSCFWNEHHDLEDRLTERLWENWKEYKDWHWNKHGFNVY